MRRLCAVAAGLVAGTFAFVISGALAGDVGFEIVRDHVEYRVDADGSYVETQEKIFHLSSPQGLDALHEVTVSYTDGYQDASIDEAYTIKRDGRRIEVPHDKMFVGYGLTTAPGFHDQKTKVAVFENVEVGDEVGYVTEFRQKKAWYPGQFFTSFALAPRVPLHDFQVSVTAPASMHIHADTNGLQGGRESNTASQQEWQWKFESGSALAPEASSVSGFDEGAYLVVTTFPDFAALAQSYEDGARGKAAPTDEIKALADRLTTGTTDRREIARKLYDWVTENLKYVAIVLGNGGLVPHSAAATLRARYGDCKDHVTLLEALLTAKGIQSSPALIDLDASYRLPTVASPELFNHLITYIPELKLYVDSTAKGVPFGVLPPSDMDKPTLLTRLGAQSRTPAEQAQTATLHTVSEVNVHADGSADIDSHFSATGPLAVDLRSTLGRLGPDADAKYLRDTTPGVIGGTVTQASPGSTADPYSASAHYKIENAANFMGPGGLSFGLGFRPKSLQSLIAAELPERHEPYVCPSFTAEDDVVISFPSGVVIESVPKSGSVSIEGMSLATSYRRLEGNTVKSSMVLKAEHPHMVCSAEYYNRVRASLGYMTRLLGAQIVYRPSDALVRQAETNVAYAPCAARKCSSQ